MKLMDFDRLNGSIDDLTKKFRELQHEVTYLRKRESNLLVSNRNLQQQMKTAQTKIQQIISRLQSIGERS